MIDCTTTVDKYPRIISERRCLIPNWIILVNIQWQLVMHQIQHLIEHLSQTTLIHKDPVTTTLVERNVAQHTAKKKWGHVIPSGGEDRGRLVLREADPLSKYLMSFRTVGLFQPLPLQNNSHYIPSLVIIYACRAQKSTSRTKHHKNVASVFHAKLWPWPSL